MEKVDKQSLIESFTDIPTHFVDGQMCLSFNDVLSCIQKATITDSKKIRDELESMEMHESKKIDDNFTIIRVPCGWIYEIYKTVGEDYQGQFTSTFVPETIQQQL